MPKITSHYGSNIDNPDNPLHSAPPTAGIVAVPDTHIADPTAYESTDGGNTARNCRDY